MTDEVTCLGFVTSSSSGAGYDGANKWFYRAYNGQVW